MKPILAFLLFLFIFAHFVLIVFAEYGPSPSPQNSSNLASSSSHDKVCNKAQFIVLGAVCLQLKYNTALVNFAQNVLLLSTIEGRRPAECARDLQLPSANYSSKIIPSLSVL